MNLLYTCLFIHFAGILSIQQTLYLLCSYQSYYMMSNEGMALIDTPDFTKILPEQHMVTKQLTSVSVQYFLILSYITSRSFNLLLHTVPTSLTSKVFILQSRFCLLTVLHNCTYHTEWRFHVIFGFVRSHGIMLISACCCIILIAPRLA